MRLAAAFCAVMIFLLATHEAEAKCKRVWWYAYTNSYANHSQCYYHGTYREDVYHHDTCGGLSGGGTGCVCDVGYTGGQCNFCDEAANYVRESPTSSTCRQCSVERDCSGIASVTSVAKSGQCMCTCGGGVCSQCSSMPFADTTAPVVCANDFPDCSVCFSPISTPMRWTDSSAMWLRTDRSGCRAYSEQTEDGLLIDVIDAVCNATYFLNTSRITPNINLTWSVRSEVIAQGANLEIVLLVFYKTEGGAQVSVEDFVEIAVVHNDSIAVQLTSTGSLTVSASASEQQRVGVIRVSGFQLRVRRAASEAPVATALINVLGLQGLRDVPVVGGPGECGAAGTTRGITLTSTAHCPAAKHLLLFNGNGGYNTTFVLTLTIESDTSGSSMLRFLGQNGEFFMITLKSESAYVDGVLWRLNKLTLSSSSSNTQHVLDLRFPRAVLRVHVDPAGSACVSSDDAVERGAIACVVMRSMIAVRGLLQTHVSTGLSDSTLSSSISDVTDDPSVAVLKPTLTANPALDVQRDVVVQDVVDSHTGIRSEQLVCLRSIDEDTWSAHAAECFLARSCPSEASVAPSSAVLTVKYNKGNVSVFAIRDGSLDPSTGGRDVFHVVRGGSIAEVTVMEILGCFAKLITRRPVRLAPNRFALYDINLHRAAGLLSAPVPPGVEVFSIHMSSVSVIPTVGDAPAFETWESPADQLRAKVLDVIATAQDALSEAERTINNIEGLLLDPQKAVAAATQLASAAFLSAQSMPLPLDIVTNVDAALAAVTECTVDYLSGVSSPVLATASGSVGKICRALSLRQFVPEYIDPFRGQIDWDYVNNRLVDWAEDKIAGLPVLRELEELVNILPDVANAFGGYATLFEAMFPEHLGDTFSRTIRELTNRADDSWLGEGLTSWLERAERPVQNMLTEVFGDARSSALTAFGKLAPWERAFGAGVLTVVAMGGVEGFNREEYLQSALQLGTSSLVKVVSNEVSSLVSSGLQSLGVTLPVGGAAGWATAAATLATSLLNGQKPSLALAVNAAISYASYAVGGLCTPVFAVVCSAAFNFVAQQAVKAVYKGKRYYPGEYGSPQEIYALYSRSTFVAGSTVPCASISPSDPNLVSAYDIKGMCTMRGTVQIVILNAAGYVAAVRAGVNADFYMQTGSTVALGGDRHNRFFAISGGNTLICGSGDCIVISEGVRNYINVGGHNATVQATSGGIAVHGGGPQLVTNVVVHGSALTPETNTITLTDGLNHTIRYDTNDTLSIDVVARDTVVLIAQDERSRTAYVFGSLQASAMHVGLGSGEKDLELTSTASSVVTTTGGAETFVLKGRSSYVMNLGDGDLKSVTHAGSGVLRLTTAGKKNYVTIDGSGAALVIALSADENVFKLGPSSDIVYGSLRGTDSYTCSGGNDMMYGGVGEQTLLCKDGDGHDVFAAQACRIQVSIDSDRAINVEAVGSSDTLIRYGVGDTLTILGCRPVDISVVSNSVVFLRSDVTDAYTSAAAAIANANVLTSCNAQNAANFPPAPVVSNLAVNERACNTIVNAIVSDCFKRKRSIFGGYYTVCVPRQPRTVQGTSGADCILGNVWSESFFSRGGCDAIFGGDGNDYAVIDTCIGGSQYFDGGPGNQDVVVNSPTSPTFIRAGSGSGSHTVTINGAGPVLVASSALGTIKVTLMSATSVHCAFLKTNNTVSGSAGTLVVAAETSIATQLDVVLSAGLFAAIAGFTSITAQVGQPSALLLGAGAHNLDLTGTLSSSYNVTAKGAVFMSLRGGTNHIICGSDLPDVITLFAVYGEVVVRPGLGANRVSVSFATRPPRTLRLVIEGSSDTAAESGTNNNTVEIASPQRNFEMQFRGTDLLLTSVVLRCVIEIRNPALSHLAVTFADTRLLAMRISNGTDTNVPEVIYGIPGVDEVMYLKNGPLKLVYPGPGATSIVCGCGAAEIYVDRQASKTVATCPCMTVKLFVESCSEGDVSVESSVVSVIARKSTAATGSCNTKPPVLVSINSTVATVVCEPSVDVEGFFHTRSRFDLVTGRPRISNVACPGLEFASNASVISVSVQPFPSRNTGVCPVTSAPFLQNCYNRISNPRVIVTRNTTFASLVALGGDNCSINDSDEYAPKMFTADMTTCSSTSITQLSYANCQLLLANDSFVSTSNTRCHVESHGAHSTTFLALGGATRYISGGASIVVGSGEADIVLVSQQTRHALFFGGNGTDVAQCPGTAAPTALLRFVDMSVAAGWWSPRQAPAWMATRQSTSVLLGVVVDMRRANSGGWGIPDIISVAGAANYSEIRSMLQQRRDGCFVGGCVLSGIRCEWLSRSDFKVANLAPVPRSPATVRETLPFATVLLQGVQDPDGDALVCTVSTAADTVLEHGLQANGNGTILVDPVSCTDEAMTFTQRCCDDFGLCAQQAFQVSVACPIVASVAAMPNLILMRQESTPVFTINSAVSLLTSRNVSVLLCLHASTGRVVGSSGDSCLRSSSRQALSLFLVDAVAEPCSELVCDNGTMTIRVTLEAPCGCSRQFTFVVPVLEPIPFSTAFITAANVALNLLDHVLSANETVRGSVEVVRSWGCGLSMPRAGVVVARPSRTAMCHGVMCVTAPVIGWRYCGWLLQDGSLAPKASLPVDPSADMIVHIAYGGGLSRVNSSVLVEAVREALGLTAAELEQLGDMPYSPNTTGAIRLTDSDAGKVWMGEKRLQSIEVLDVDTVLVSVADASNVTRPVPEGVASSKVTMAKSVAELLNLSSAADFNKHMIILGSSHQQQHREVQLLATELTSLFVVAHDLADANSTHITFTVSAYTGRTAYAEARQLVSSATSTLQQVPQVEVVDLAVPVTTTTSEAPLTSAPPTTVPAITATPSSEPSPQGTLTTAKPATTNPGTPVPPVVATTEAPQGGSPCPLACPDGQCVNSFAQCRCFDDAELEIRKTSFTPSLLLLNPTKPLSGFVVINYTVRRTATSTNCAGLDLSNYARFVWSLGSVFQPNIFIANGSALRVPARAMQPNAFYTLTLMVTGVRPGHGKATSFTVTTVAPEPTATISRNGATMRVSNREDLVLQTFIVDPYPIGQPYWQWTCSILSVGALRCLNLTNATADRVVVPKRLPTGTFRITFVYAGISSSVDVTVINGDVPKVGIVLQSESLVTGAFIFMPSQKIVLSSTLQYNVVSAGSVVYSWAVNGEVVSSRTALTLSAATLQVSAPWEVAAKSLRRNRIALVVTDVDDPSIFGEAVIDVFVVPFPSLQLVASASGDAAATFVMAGELLTLTVVTDAASLIGAPYPSWGIDFSYSYFTGMTRYPLTPLTRDHIVDVASPVPWVDGGVVFEVCMHINGVPVVKANTTFELRAGNVDVVASLLRQSASIISDAQTALVASTNMLAVAHRLEAAHPGSNITDLHEAVAAVLVRSVNNVELLSVEQQNGVFDSLAAVSGVGSSGVASLATKMVLSSTFNAAASGSSAASLLSTLPIVEVHSTILALAKKLAVNPNLPMYEPIEVTSSAGLILSAARIPAADIRNFELQCGGPSVKISAPSEFVLPGCQSCVVSVATVSLNNNPFSGTPLGGVYSFSFAFDGTPAVIQNLAVPLKISLPQRRGFCHYWNPEASVWSSDGVATSLEHGSVVCSTTHLTSFAVFSEPVSSSAAMIGELWASCLLSAFLAVVLW